MAPLRNNLPAPVNSFVGREAELRESARLLGTARLLTLTGPSGAGKSRLALQVAARVSPAVFADGAWLVELADLKDPSVLARAVASALGVHDEPTVSPDIVLRDYLRHRTLLLILDSCEHLVNACAALTADLLHACRGLHILATSQTTLDVEGEVVLQVAPLPVPDPASHGIVPTDLMRYAGARLFVERAAACSPGFAVTPENAGSVAEVCTQLDGIPLALEIAAARVRVLSVEQLAGRLSDRFGVLTGGNRRVPRHQTLRAAVDWSYELLSDAERLLFNRLTVFESGWTLDATESVCVDERIAPADVLDLLASLVTKSLVVASNGGTGAQRYRMLETIRQYGSEQLERSGEADQVRQRHLEWFVELANRAETHFTEPDQAAWLNWMKAEHRNIRAALRWALDHGRGETAADLAGSLWRYWDVGGLVREGRAWLDEALASTPERSPARAKALIGLGYLALLQADVATACAVLEEALELSHELQDEICVGTSLIILGMAARARGAPGLAEDLLQEALTMARRAGHRLGTYSALYLLASVVELQGEHERAMALHEESLELKRAHGDVWGIAVSLSTLATLSLERGDAVRARTLLEESLELRWALQDRDGIADCLDGLARAAVAANQLERAPTLHGAADALRESIGLPAPDLDLHDLRARLGSQAFETAWKRGRELPLDAVIKLALEEDHSQREASVGSSAAIHSPILTTHRGDGGPAAIVFIHGFNAKPHLTWGSFPDFLIADSRLADWDVFSVGYPTSVQFDLASIWTADPPLAVLADNLRLILSLAPLGRYRSLAIIGHSMGGLVVQRALVDDDALAARTGHVFLFACPSMGSRKARIMRFWKRQLRDMARGSRFIADLRERWRKFDRPEFVLKVIAGDIDEFVSRSTTLEPFPSRTRVVIRGDHLSLVYAKTADDQCVQVVIEGLLSGGGSARHAADMRDWYRTVHELAPISDRLDEDGLLRLAQALERTGRIDDAIAVLEGQARGGSVTIMARLASQRLRRWLSQHQREDAVRAHELFEAAFRRAAARLQFEQARLCGVGLAFLELAFRKDQPAARGIATRVLDMPGGFDSPSIDAEAHRILDCAGLDGSYEHGIRIAELIDDPRPPERIGA